MSKTRAVAVGLILAAMAGSPGTAFGLGDKPNVVLIVCDDLNDYITGIPGQTGHPQARTPNVDRLARSGVAFRRAYSNNPVCAPSRASFLTGIYPHTSKNLFWDKWYENPVLKNSKTVMEHFRDNGYHTAGTGKLMHHFKRNVWSEFAHQADYGPFVHDGKKTIAHPSVPKPFGDIGAVDGSFGSLADVPFADDDNPLSGWVYAENWKSKPMRYASENDRDPTPDERNAAWAAERIKRFAAQKDGKPFFLGVGFIRPHTPLHVPQKYFDMFPIDTVRLPELKPNDAADCHYADVFDEDVKGLKYFRLLGQSYPEKDAGLRAFTRAYLACVAAVDECIGRVVDAVDNSPLKDNTIVVLTSDHGWNMGEKDFLFKNCLWEESTRVPFVVRAPGLAKPGGIAEHPVSLIDLYPTLVDLCGLKGDTRKNENGAPLDGHSVRPFLEDPAAGRWGGPEGALTMVNADENARVDLPDEDYNNPDRQHWSIRTRRWRYIRYNNGAEELYDHDSDPYEWTNLADTPDFEKQTRALRRQLTEMAELKDGEDATTRGGAGTPVPSAAKWQKNRARAIPYKVGWKHNLSVRPVGDRHVLQGNGKGFGLTVVPRQGPVWNMEPVAALGLMLKNTGKTDLKLDLMVCNAGATEWSNSALGGTVVKAGEELPLVTALVRPRYEHAHAHYNKMSGKPNGHRRHWQKLDAARIRSLVIKCADKGAHTFEIAELFPYQSIDNSDMGKFPFVDKYGQYMFGDWPGKVRCDEDLPAGVAAEKKLETELGKPTGFTRYGGWKQGPRLEATGAFRTQRHNGRWWFVDPEGYLFWSYGVCCVGADWAEQSPLRNDLSVYADLPARDDPEFGRFFTFLDVEGPDYTKIEGMPHYDFTRANLHRKYGGDWEQRHIAQTIKRMLYCNLNTIGAWSDNNVVTEKKVPYTAMVHYEYAFAAQKLPDPFHPETRSGLRKSLHEYPVDIRNDPWCLGAFVNNELRWQNNDVSMVCAILAYEEEGTEAKKVFRDWLRKKYDTIQAFNTAWSTSFAAWDDLLKGGADAAVFKKARKADCDALASLLADAFFKMVREELNAFSPKLLYLGCRFNTAGAEVRKAAARYADVLSVNNYKYRPNVGVYASLGKPVLISEFHFVDISGCNLGSGLRTATDAVQQGRLFRAYMEEAVNAPSIVGAHWFQWKDQNVTGRYDGENYDVGFFDIADKPNVELIRAAEEYGRVLYDSVK